MNTLIIIVFVLALIHFIYEGIIMPSLRLSIRYRLFSLRDSLRDLKSEFNDDISDNLFKMIDDGLSYNICNLHNINFYVIGTINKHIESNDSLKNAIIGRMKLIEECKIEEIKRITAKSQQYLLNTALINSGAWFIYITPITIGLVIPAILIIALINKIKVAIKNAVNNTLYAPLFELNKSIVDIELMPA